MALELTFSCDSDKTDDGPTLIHSTGVEYYKISPGVVSRRKPKDFFECLQGNVIISLTIYLIKKNT